MVCEFHGFHIARPGSAATVVSPRPIGSLIRLTFAEQNRYVVFLSCFHNRAFYPTGHTSKLLWTFSQEFIRKNDLLLVESNLMD